VNKGIIAAVVGLLALALVGAGCGGGDETTELTRAQFIKQGNAICKQQKEKRDATIRAAIKGQDQSKLLPLKQREEVVLEILPPYEEVPERLKALGTPEGEEEKVEAIYGAMEDAAQKVKADPAEALKSTTQFTKANELSSAYGLTECAV